MNSVAKVIDIKNNNVILEMPKGGGCASSRMFKTTPHTFSLPIPKDQKPNIGDIAIIEIDPKKSILSSFIIFIFPLLLFVPAYYLGLKISNNSQSISTLIGLIGIIIGLIIIFFINKKLNKFFTPKIKEFTKTKLPPICEACKMSDNCSSK